MAIKDFGTGNVLIQQASIGAQTGLVLRADCFVDKEQLRELLVKLAEILDGEGPAHEQFDAKKQMLVQFEAPAAIAARPSKEQVEAALAAGANANPKPRIELPDPVVSTQLAKRLRSRTNGK